MADQKELELAFLRDASRNHLDRAKQLAETEWKVSFVFWTAVGAVDAFGVANIDKIARLLLDNAFPVVISFQLSAIGFLFGFCKNNHISLTTERGLYQYFQNEAATVIGCSQWKIVSKTGKDPANKSTADFAFVESKTWGFKALTTLAMVNASFSLLYWTAWYSIHPAPAVHWTVLGIAAAGSLTGLTLAFSGKVRRRVRWLFDSDAEANDKAAVKNRRQHVMLDRDGRSNRRAGRRER